MPESREVFKRWLPLMGAIVLFGAMAIAVIPRSPRAGLAASADQQLLDSETGFLRRGNPGLKEVALTFDDGPHPASIKLILDQLHTYGVKATFFVVGRRVDEHPEWAVRITEEGHAIGNHTYTHDRMTAIPYPDALDEVARCDAALMKAIGRRTMLFRPPGMHSTHDILCSLKAFGYTTVGWTDAAKDFETESYKITDLNAEEIAQRVMAKVRNGSIILLHDTVQTAQALPRVIAYLRLNGYTFVTIPEMIDHLPPR